MTTSRRVHERYEHEIKVRVTHSGGEFECATKDLSLGGMHLLTSDVLALGTKVELTFYLAPLKEDVTLAATVRWASGGRMGVQFGSLRAREVWAFNQLFRAS